MHGSCPYCKNSIDLPTKLFGEEVICPFCFGEFLAEEKPKKKPNNLPPPILADVVNEQPISCDPRRSIYASPKRIPWLWIACLIIWLPLLAFIAPWLILAGMALLFIGQAWRREN